MTAPAAPDAVPRDVVDVEEALSQFKQDLVAVDEAVWSGLARRLPERRGAMQRLKGAGTSRADLMTRKAPTTVRPAVVPMAGASGSMWSAISQHSAVVDLLPALGTSATAVCFAGSAAVAAGLMFEPTSPRDKEALQRLQETARAGVELSLELAQLEAALNDALANNASSTAIRPVLKKSVDRVNKTLEDYLVALDTTHGLGDLDVHFPWAVDAELDPSTVRIRQTLTIDAESLRSSVHDFIGRPGSLVRDRTRRAVSGSTAGTSAVARTADDLAQRIGTLADTMNEASQVAEREGADGMHDAFAHARVDGVFTHDTLRRVADTGSAEATVESFESAARRFAGYVEDACSQLTGSQAKIFAKEEDLRGRLGSAVETARQTILSAQYLDVIVETPALGVSSAAQPATRRVATTIDELKTVAAELHKNLRCAAMSVRAAGNAFAAYPGSRQRLQECAISAQAGQERLFDVLTQAALMTSAPDLRIAMSGLEHTAKDIAAVQKACDTFDARLSDAVWGARRHVKDPILHPGDEAVEKLVATAATARLPMANRLAKVWTALLDDVRALAT